MTETWILCAGIAVWSGIGLYLAFLAAKQRSLSKKISSLEALTDDSEI